MTVPPGDPFGGGGPGTPPGFQPPARLQDSYDTGPLAAPRRPLMAIQRLLAAAVGIVVLVGLGLAARSLVSPGTQSSSATLDGDSGAVISPELPTFGPGPSLSASPSPKKGPVPKPVRYTGSGSKTIRIRKPEAGLAILHVTGNAARERFFIREVDPDGVQGAVIIASFTPYDGVQVIDSDGAEPTWGLRVEATGPWTVELRSPRGAPAFSRTAKGSRSGVFLYTGRAGTASLTGGSSAPGSALTVRSYHFDDSGPRIVALLIDRRTERIHWPAGPVLVEFDTDAPWSVTVG